MNSKYNLFHKTMIAFIVSAVFFAGCKHDAAEAGFTSVNNTTESTTTSTDATTSALASSNLILDANFDGSPFTGFTLSNNQFCCNYSITQVASPDGGSGKSLKYDLRKTDATVSGSKRAEIQLAGTDAPETSERWYGVRYWLEKYDADNGAESILQWHDQDGTTPPLSIQVQGGHLRIMQSFTSGNIPTDIGATVLKKWINIVIHVKWSNSTNGLLEVWRDGTKVVSKTNVRTNSKGGSYLKLGINKWTWYEGSSSSTQRIFYIDNFKYGNESASFDAVNPATTTSGGSGGGGTTTPPVTPPAGNQSPVVSAGSAQTISLPTSAVTLKGTASDPDGTIASYAWTKVSGNGGTITSSRSATTSVTGLTAGSYTYNLKVTDNKGATASSNVIVTVNGTTQGGGGSGTRANLMLDANFDGSNPFTGFSLNGQQYCCNYSITQVNSPDGAAGKVLKYDLRKTDATVSGSKRAEIELSGNGAPETSERWYGLRYWLEKYDADNGPESIIQWHDQDGTTPPLSLQIASGRMRIMQSFTSGNIPTDIGATVTGRWISIVIHVKWTTSTTGVLEVWRDGTKVVSKVNVRTNSRGGSYLKLGINKWSWYEGSSSSTQRIFYIDNFRMGNEKATYNDVAP